MQETNLLMKFKGLFNISSELSKLNLLQFLLERNNGVLQATGKVCPLIPTARSGESPCVLADLGARDKDDSFVGCHRSEIS